MLLDDLSGLIRPHLAAAAGDKAEADARAAWPGPYDAEEVKLFGRFAALCCLDGGGSIGEAKRLAREVMAEARAVKGPTSEEVAAAAARTLDVGAAMLGRDWLAVLMLAGRDDGLAGILDPRGLDDAMLPGDRPLKEAFADRCGLHFAGESACREALRRLRASLPEGERLPRVAVLLLQMAGVAIVR